MIFDNSYLIYESCCNFVPLYRVLIVAVGFSVAAWGKLMLSHML
jgi:hypothetical protein